MHRHLVTFTLGLASSVSLLPAQEVLWRVSGGTSQLVQTRLSPAVTFIGDVDGDGTDDAVLAQELSSPPLTHEMRIVSGATGATLRIDSFTVAGHSPSAVVPTGDMNGDGVGDYAVGSVPLMTPFTSNLVTVYSAADGQVIWQVSGPRDDSFGARLVGDLDLDGDGLPDLVVAAPREEVYGRIHAFDHFGYKLYVTSPHQAFTAGSLGGDLNGDGCDDFVIGANIEIPNGAVRVLSGRDGAILRTIVGENFGDGLGTGSVGGCGDVDGDGMLDFFGSADGILKPSIVAVFSGRTGRCLYQWRPGFNLAYGARVAAGDLDLDGVHDLLIYTVLCGGNQALDWPSLRDGRVVKQLCTPGNGTQFGNVAAIGRPQPSNPFPVMLVHENRFRPGGFIGPDGRVSMIRAAPAGVTPLGPGCTGTLANEPQLGFTDFETAGVEVHVSNAPAGTDALLLLGLSSNNWLGTPLPLALNAFGLAGCSLRTSVDLAVPVMTGNTGNEVGHAKVVIPVSLATGTPQLMLNGQWMVFQGGAPAAMSAALSWGH